MAGNKIILSLGSNIGDRLSHLNRAIEELGEILIIDKISSIYETPPLEMESDNKFYNLCLSATTDLDPEELLKKINTIEQSLGRTRTPGTGYQSRKIDIDIITYNTVIYNSTDLTLPHPKYKDRRFVLIPILEIDPGFSDPETHIGIKELVTKCQDNSIIVRIDKRIVLNT